ncbi:MAG TPA: hypothetical protein DCG42_07200 [Maribacter sp.]|uniref:hypothetical protein n=1 Tax=unclassified Maribacter TaxID=2615042 RepID=UPI000ECBF1D8|nr:MULTISPECIES: hypothetical protein [unclassified Maribacter]HAF77094.1 hypothetical protein [Maribacter sp.]|tara:strand:+ start:365 stop:556 length:192 start_codon:yes stop_codon:yes gene_type:complete
MAKENIFKRIGLPLKEVPPDLKERVLADIEDANALIELSSLFSLEYPKTGDEIFRKIRHNKTR